VKDNIKMNVKRKYEVVWTTQDRDWWRALVNILRNSLFLKIIEKILNSCLVKGRSMELVYLVLCGCETWLITLKGECKLRVMQNKAISGIFGLRE
jgi:hypothetical protein